MGTGDLTVNGNDITFGNGATIVNTDADTLTITEATTVFSGTIRAATIDLSSGTQDTDDLSEGSSNLYYTDARADARVAAGITGKLDASEVSTFGGTLIDDADAAAARTTLGLGTAATTASTAYATAAQGSTADSALQASAVSTFGGSLIDDADAAAARTTLGLGTAATTA